MLEDFKLVARPEGVHKGIMGKGLVSLTGAETALQSSEAPALLANPDAIGFVYFIRAGRMCAVKIGQGQDPEVRSRELQTASHHKLHLIGFIPGDRLVEQEWHARFRYLRIRGEWFTLTDDLRQAINDALHSADAVSYSHLSLDRVRATARALAA